LRLTFDPARREAETRGVFEMVERAAVDEVMFFVPHAEERSPGLGTAAEIAVQVEALGPVFERLRGMGVAPSINMWWTLSFSDFPNLPRDQRGTFPGFRWAVGLDGRVSRVAACPRDPAWRGAVAEMYAAYASLRPERIWMDDDVRAIVRADLHSPCVCDVCLAAWCEKTGRRWGAGIF